PVLEDVIRKLDIPRAMVYIECLIMEVNITRSLNVGTEWRTSEAVDGGSKAIFGGFGASGDSGFANSGTVSGGSLPKGFSVGVLGESFTVGGVTFPNIQAVVAAFKGDEDVHILSTPQLLTTENEEAEIYVGKNVPYQTRSAAESASETYSSFEYKDVGITLKITPQISKGKLVRLDVYQELSKLDSVSTVNDDRPTTLKRKVETTIIVQDSHSVVIGGLIDESITKAQDQTPCLGGVPGLGWAFKNVNEGEERTNLYVFITPRVVRSPEEASALYNKKKTEIDTSVKREEITLYEKVERIEDKLSGKGEPEPPAENKPEVDEPAPPADNTAQDKASVSHAQPAD
ncbi:MAG: type II secretion system protein GspD, partial [Desulfobacterales bacterium]|nr:type II secretion system protein GspD [Desulfobacterales bacterium]